MTFDLLDYSLWELQVAILLQQGLVKKDVIYKDIVGKKMAFGAINLLVLHKVYLSLCCHQETLAFQWIPTHTLPLPNTPKGTSSPQ